MRGKSVVAIAVWLLLGVYFAEAQLNTGSTLIRGSVTVNGTSSQITATQSGSTITLSIPNPFTPPGTLAMGANNVTSTGTGWSAGRIALNGTAGAPVIALGGFDVSSPALRANAADLSVVLGDDSAYAVLRASQIATQTGGVSLNAQTFANIGVGGTGNGLVKYCSDCALTTVGTDNTCTSGGTGALAVRINDVWRCFNAQDT